MADGQINPEHKLIITWMINTDPKGDTFLLVAGPGGQVLDFPITEEAADKLPDVLNDDNLWKTVFTSLIASLKGTPSA
jgi:hypothetical protein